MSNSNSNSNTYNLAEKILAKEEFAGESRYLEKRKNKNFQNSTRETSENIKKVSGGNLIEKFEKEFKKSEDSKNKNKSNNSKYN